MLCLFSDGPRTQPPHFSDNADMFYSKNKIWFQLIIVISIGQIWQKKIKHLILH